MDQSMEATSTVSKLSARELLFVSTYVTNNFNCKRAALACGFSEASAHELGSRMLKKVEVKKAIDEILQNNAMTKLELLHRLGEIARNRTIDYLQSDGSIDIEAMKADGCLWLLKNYRVNPKTGKVAWQVYDALKAQETLAKVYGLVNDNPLVTINIDEKITAEKELTAELQRIHDKFMEDPIQRKVMEYADQLRKEQISGRNN